MAPQGPLLAFSSVNPRPAPGGPRTDDGDLGQVIPYLTGLSDDLERIRQTELVRGMPLYWPSK